MLNFSLESLKTVKRGWLHVDDLCKSSQVRCAVNSAMQLSVPPVHKVKTNVQTMAETWRSTQHPGRPPDYIKVRLVVLYCINFTTGADLTISVSLADLPIHYSIPTPISTHGVDMRVQYVWENMPYS